MPKNETPDTTVEIETPSIGLRARISSKALYVGTFALGALSVLAVEALKRRSTPNEIEYLEPVAEIESPDTTV